MSDDSQSMEKLLIPHDKRIAIEAAVMYIMQQAENQYNVNVTAIDIERSSDGLRLTNLHLVFEAKTGQ